MIRRYASHLLYGPGGEDYKQYVVELHDGIMHAFYPLVREMPSVIWLGGVVILSPQEDPVLETGLSFAGLIVSLTSCTGPTHLYAYALKGVNLSSLTLSPTAFLEKLS